jgi:hypothetical protein
MIDYNQMTNTVVRESRGDAPLEGSKHPADARRNEPAAREGGRFSL